MRGIIYFMLTTLYNICASDVIISASKRQARALKSTYQKQHLREKNTVCEMPKILSWQTFITFIWQKFDLHSKALLLTRAQQFFLWSELLGKKKFPAQHKLTALIHKEYQLAQRFLILEKILSKESYTKNQRFQDYIGAYQKFLSANNLCDEFEIIRRVIHQKISLPFKAVYYYGFHTLTPEQKLFFKKIGAQVLPKLQVRENIHYQSKIFTHTSEELLAAAHLAKAHYDAHPDTQTAIIIPDLAQRQKQVVRILDGVFFEHQDILENWQKPYHISLGKTLCEYALVAGALDILHFSLQCYKGEISPRLFSSLLCSPYVKGAKEELGARFAFDIYLQSQHPQIFLKKTHIQHILNATPCKILAKLLLGFSTFISTLDVKNTRSYGAHNDNFSAILNYWGWPQIGLSSTEYQVFSKWQEAQLTFNTLEIIKSTPDFESALFDWQQLLSMTMFAPKEEAASIHILTPKEAAGIHFDKMWITQMSDDFLPGKLNLPYFIDTYLAKTHKLPKSNYELLTKEAQLILSDFMTSGCDIFVSYARLSGGKIQQPSPLVCFEDSIDAPNFAKNTQQNVNNFAQNSFETFTDDKAPHLNDKHIKYGVGVLSAQAECAFKGFAYRLNIPRITPMYIGLSPIDKGGLMHRMLESLWKDVKNSNVLAEYKNKLPSLVDRHIGRIFSNKKNAFEQLEVNRIRSILCTYLEKELTRTPFRVIALEKEQTVDINGLIFAIRLDRMDEQENGANIIFDYKTSKVSLINCAISAHAIGGIIREAQLPIYALKNSVDGVAFISLRTDGIRYVGCVNEKIDDIVSSKNNNNYGEIITFWRTELNATSLAFQQGKATVAPNAKACDYCQLAPLCRIE